jgi:hypothetical protein
MMCALFLEPTDGGKQMANETPNITSKTSDNNSYHFKPASPKKVNSALGSLANAFANNQVSALTTNAESDSQKN